MTCFTKVITAQLQALRCCSVLLPSCTNQCITAQQLAQSFNLHKKLFTSAMISDIQRIAWDRILRASQSNTKLGDKPCLWSRLHMLKLHERLSYFELLQQMKPGSIALHHRQKGIPWNGTIPKLHRRKNWLCQQTCLQSLLTRTVKEWSLWMKCQEGRKLTQTMSRCWKNSWRDSNELAPQEFSWSLDSTWQCKAACMFEVSASHHTIWLVSVTPPTLQPWRHTCRFPTIWSPEGCCLWWEVWD